MDCTFGEERIEWNIDELDEKALGMNIITEVQKDKKLNIVMSNSFGFGGTNASLVFKRYDA